MAHRLAPLLLLLVTHAACDEDALMAGGDGGPACPPPTDLSVAARGGPAFDFWHPSGTGDPCDGAADCVAGALGPATCLTEGFHLTWPGGYCTSPCRLEDNDPESGINPACPGGAGTCYGFGQDGGAGELCVLLCIGGRACSADRYQYQCDRNGFTALCLSAGGEHQCDWQRSGSCGAGQTCVAIFSDLEGWLSSSCQATCDLLAPPPGCNCQRDQLGEGFCAAPVPLDMGAGTFCRSDPFWARCPVGYGCLPVPPAGDYLCERNCSPDDPGAACAPCATCEAVKDGAGICTASR